MKNFSTYKIDNIKKLIEENDTKLNIEDLITKIEIFNNKFEKNNLTLLIESYKNYKDYNVLIINILSKLFNIELKNEKVIKF